MSQVFMLPDLGEGLTEAEISQWLVKVGDVVVVDQPIVEVETAKAAVEVPSPFAGTVVTLHGEAGEVMEVGKPLITVAAAGQTGSVESTPADRPEVATSPSTEAAAAPGPSASAEAESEASGAVLIGYGTSGHGASGRRRRAPRGAIPEPVAAGGVGTPPEGSHSVEEPQGRSGQVSSTSGASTQTSAAPDAQASTGQAEAPRVSSPLVRKFARENGVRVSELTGTGPEGLILRRDVEKAIAEAANPGSTASGLAGSGECQGYAGPGEALGESAAASSSDFTCGTELSADGRTGLQIVSRTPVKGLRKVVSESMAKSRRDIPEATVWVDVDATKLMTLRAQLKEEQGTAPGLLAFISRFALAGLAKYPELAMRVEQGSEGEEIVAFSGINLGFAAQTPRGLVVPSLEGAERMSASELDAAIREMTAKAREGKCTPAELTRGTFTVNNYGVFGVDGSAAIINAPEVAILGLGRIIERPWVVPSKNGGPGRIRVRQVMELTLAFDHRVCDGGTAGGFLRFVADCIENPKALLQHL